MSKKFLHRRKTSKIDTEMTEEHSTTQNDSSESHSSETFSPKVEIPPRQKLERVVVDTTELMSELENFSMDSLFSSMDTKAKRKKVGDIVQGVVSAQGRDCIFVDIGEKSEAILDTNPNDFELGATIEATIIKIGHDGIRLAQKIQHHNDLELFTIALEQNLPIEGTITEANNGGFIINFGAIRGFCPKSQMDFGKVDAAKWIGQQQEFLITQIKSDEIIVSRRKLLEREKAKQHDQIMSELKVGDEKMGTVLKILDFGAFVDIGGVDGLLPRSILNSISGTLEEGDEIKVCIEKIQQDKISLSAPFHNPWLKMGTQYQLGGIYNATITKIKDFGTFAQLESNLEGLISKNVASNPLDPTEDTENALKVGDQIQVLIQHFDIQSKKIKLQILKQSAAQSTSHHSVTFADAYGDLLDSFLQEYSQEKPAKKSLKTARKK